MKNYQIVIKKKNKNIAFLSNLSKIFDNNDK